LLTLAYEGSADTIVKTAARHDVQAIRTRDDDLEDSFRQSVTRSGS
jgi:hypothetical protein